MADTITAAGRALLAQCQAENRPCVIDRFILAYVPNQDASTPIAIGRSFPEAKDIVHEQAVSEVGFLNPDTISYSLFMDEHSGPFIFNTIYTVASGDNTVVQIVTVPDTPKFAENSAKNIRGQAMVRNLLLVYQNAQAIAQITVEANTWQFAYEKATENLWGITQEATQGQVNEGAVAQRFVSPEKLENWWKRRVLHRHSWDQIDDKPDTATRNPTWDEVSGKPHNFTNDLVIRNRDALRGDLSRRVWLFNGRYCAGSSLYLDVPWTDFHELIFYIGTDTLSWMSSFYVKVQDIIAVAECSVYKDFLVSVHDRYIRIKADTTDYLHIVGENSNVTRIIGINYD